MTKEKRERVGMDWQVGRELEQTFHFSRHLWSDNLISLVSGNGSLAERATEGIVQLFQTVRTWLTCRRHVFPLVSRLLLSLDKVKRQAIIVPDKHCRITLCV